MRGPAGLFPWVLLKALQYHSHRRSSCYISLENQTEPPDSEVEHLRTPLVKDRQKGQALPSCPACEFPRKSRLTMPRCCSRWTLGLLQQGTSYIHSAFNQEDHFQTAFKINSVWRTLKLQRNIGALLPILFSTARCLHAYVVQCLLSLDASKKIALLWNIIFFRWLWNLGLLKTLSLKEEPLTGKEEPRKVPGMPLPCTLLCNDPQHDWDCAVCWFCSTTIICFHHGHLVLWNGVLQQHWTNLAPKL